MDEAKKYHLRPECRIEMQNERTRARLGTGQVLYILGGFGNSQTPVDVVERYDSRTEQSTFVQVKRKAEKMVGPSEWSLCLAFHQWACTRTSVKWMGWNGIRWEGKGLSFYLIAILGDLLKTHNVILDAL